MKRTATILAFNPNRPKATKATAGEIFEVPGIEGLAEKLRLLAVSRPGALKAIELIVDKMLANAQFPVAKR